MLTWRAANPPQVEPPVIAIPPVELQHNDWPLEADAQAFFGYPPNMTRVEPPFRMTYEGVVVKDIGVNIKIAASLRRIFAAVANHFNHDQAALDASGITIYDGCFNDRNIIGSSHKSMHAVAAAVDFDSEHNGFNTGHGKIHPFVVQCFKAEGWRWGGDYTGRTDPMHFEACH